MSEKQFLQVIWTRNSHLKHKNFPLDKKEQAFNWYWRINGDIIVLRGADYEPSFSESNVPEFVQRFPEKERYRKVFDEWLKDYSELSRTFKPKPYKRLLPKGVRYV